MTTEGEEEVKRLRAAQWGPRGADVAASGSIDYRPEHVHGIHFHNVGTIVAGTVAGNLTNQASTPPAAQSGLPVRIIGALLNHPIFSGIIVVVVGGVLSIGIYKIWGLNIFDPSTSHFHPSSATPSTQP
jgi:hypothetical protein